MKINIIIFALLIFTQSFCFNCSFLDFMSGTYNDVSNFFSKIYGNIKEKIKNYLISEYVGEQNRKFVDQPVIKLNDMKNVFSDYITSQAGDGEENKYNINPKKYPSRILATPQLAFWHGRHMESHVVETKDGYFLTVHRLLAYTQEDNRTVLLHHGILGSSTDWILLGPKKSLPYLLADAGYDVWITNARGNYYSRVHTSTELESADYWKFSWQEMGEFDLPAVIDYIKYTKNSTESINFIGHSMGATALLVLLSTTPEYNKYLRMGILLAPLAFMDNVQGPLKVMKGLSEDVIKLLGDGEFLPSRRVPSWMATKYCTGPKIFCRNPLLFLSGTPKNITWNASFIARLLYHTSAGGSTNTILHYMQVAQSGKLHRFHQPDKEFPLYNITLPMAFISSDADWLATIPDVNRLVLNLSSTIDHHIIHNRDLTHTDLVWGIDAYSLVFTRVLQYIEKGLEWSNIKQNEVV